MLMRGAGKSALRGERHALLPGRRRLEARLAVEPFHPLRGAGVVADVVGRQMAGGLRPDLQGKGSALATKAVETQGKDSVLATKAVRKHKAKTVS